MVVIVVVHSEMVGTPTIVCVLVYHSMNLDKLTNASFCDLLPPPVVYATLETTELTVPETRGTRAELCLLIDDERSIELEFRATPVAINATRMSNNQPT